MTDQTEPEAPEETGRLLSVARKISDTRQRSGDEEASDIIDRLIGAVVWQRSQHRRFFTDTVRLEHELAEARPGPEAVVEWEYAIRSANGITWPRVALHDALRETGVAGDIAVRRRPAGPWEPVPALPEGDPEQ